MSDTNTLQILGTFAGVCVVNVTAFAVVWIQGKTRSDRTDIKIDDVSTGLSTAADKADVVAKRVEPVSNGFAGKVLTFLDEAKRERAADRAELREAIARFDRHIGDHATADVRRHTE